MLGELPLTSTRPTVGADKNHDTRAWVAAVRAMGITPHVAQSTRYRSSAIDRRTTRHSGYALSERCRKKVEQPFGWMKTVGLREAAAPRREEGRLDRLLHRGGVQPRALADADRATRVTTRSVDGNDRSSESTNYHQ